MSDAKAGRPRADVEEMVRQYYAAKGWPDELWAMGFEEAVKFAEHFRREAATLLSQEHARAQKAEARVEALLISEETLNRALASEVELRNKVYVERVEKAEARAEQLERLLSEADEVIAWWNDLLIDEGGCRGREMTADEAAWFKQSSLRHASRASPKRK